MITTGFNLRSIKTAQDFELTIKDTDGNSTPVVFVLAGPNHPARKALDMTRNRQVINSANRHGRVILPDPAVSEERKPKDLAGLTLGWSGYIDEQGTTVQFSSATAQELYSDPEMQWLVDQVEEALGNKALFTRSASAT